MFGSLIVLTDAVDRSVLSKNPKEASEPGIPVRRHPLMFCETDHLKEKAASFSIFGR